MFCGIREDEWEDNIGNGAHVILCLIKKTLQTKSPIKATNKQPAVWAWIFFFFLGGREDCGFLHDIFGPVVSLNKRKKKN